MMHSSEWKLVKHFKPPPHENWGDTDLLVGELVYRLDALRAYIGKPIIVHCAAELTGHAVNSQHYLGRAADVSCPSISLAEFAWAASQFRFTGIGINHYWHTPGLHLDVRLLEPYEKSAVWIYWQKHHEHKLDIRELTACYCKALHQQCLKLRREEITHV